MRKISILILTSLLCSSNICIAETNMYDVFSGIRNSVQTISDINKLKNEITNTPIKNDTKQAESINQYEKIPVVENNVIQQQAEEKNINQPVEVSFYAGLKPDSSLVEVINAFKKNSGVTKMDLGYYERSGPYLQVMTFKSCNKNLKNVPTDATSILNIIGNLLSSSIKNRVQLNNGTGIMVNEDLYLQIEKIYLDGVPFSVEVKFVPSAGYYLSHANKVLKGASGNAFPYVIETIKMSTDKYDNATKNLVYSKRENIYNQYVQKYGENYADFLSIHRSDTYMEITYKNYDYINELNYKYNEFATNRSIQQTEKFNSINEI